MIEPHFQNETVTVYHGDCLDVLAQLPDASVDSVVTDPPYGLDFMGKHWDTGAVAFDTAVWGHCLRVLKPGGHLLAFGGTRTWHRLAAAVEDAGFEIRDSIAWLYGSGFPKSMNAAKAIDRAAGVLQAEGKAFTVAGYSHNPDNIAHTAPSAGYVPPQPVTDDAKRWEGWGTALKPAFEPIVVGRKPLAGTVAANVVQYGTGAINIDACRVPTNDKLGGGHASAGQQMKDGWHRPWMDDPEAVAANAERSRASVARSEELGRWPANVTIDPDVANEIDQQSGRTVSNKKSSGKASDMRGGNYNSNEKRLVDIETPAYGDSGGASRYFPVFRYHRKASKAERPNVNNITHPTVKPLELIRWLVRLITPPDGTVLDPFAGSGTTAEACTHENKHCITIEREADYLPLITSRLNKDVELGFDF